MVLRELVDHRQPRAIEVRRPAQRQPHTPPRRHSERIVGHFWHRGTVAEQRIERCGAHPSDRREIAREGHGFIDADESLLAILAAVHLPEFIRAAELEASIGEMAVIARLVAVLVHTGMISGSAAIAVNRALSSHISPHCGLPAARLDLRKIPRNPWDQG